MIHYKVHKEIDKSRWDNCILNSPNGLIYATSWYLDQLSPGWDGLVLNDYAAVMPLPCKKKWGINYLIRPDFCQQLGVFGTTHEDSATVQAFIQAIPSHFRFIDITLNESNHFESELKGINHLLDLSASYENLRSSFSQNTKRNLAKALEFKYKTEYSTDIVSLVKLKQNHAFSRVSFIHEGFLIQLFEKYKSSGNALILTASDEKGEMMAAALFIHYRNRWIYLLSASSSKGKEKRAMFSIIDKFIADHAGSTEILDFEGSVIPELARFFTGFGASSIEFPRLRLNRLPFPLNILKR